MECFLSDIRSGSRMAGTDMRKGYKLFDDVVIFFGTEQNNSSISNPPDS